VTLPGARFGKPRAGEPVSFSQLRRNLNVEIVAIVQGRACVFSEKPEQVF
jgi:hypothetical protein